jgi:hypothetical protein
MCIIYCSSEIAVVGQTELFFNSTSWGYRFKNVKFGSISISCARVGCPSCHSSLLYSV